MTGHAPSIRQYSSNLAGVAEYALAMHRWAVARYNVAPDVDRMLYTGQAQAFSSIVCLITGRRPNDPVAADVIKGLSR